MADNEIPADVLSTTDTDFRPEAIVRAVDDFAADCATSGRPARQADCRRRARTRGQCAGRPRGAPDVDDGAGDDRTVTARGAGRCPRSRAAAVVPCTAACPQHHGGRRRDRRGHAATALTPAGERTRDGAAAPDSERRDGTALPVWAWRSEGSAGRCARCALDHQDRCTGDAARAEVGERIVGPAQRVLGTRHLEVMTPGEGEEFAGVDAGVRCHGPQLALLK